MAYHGKGGLEAMQQEYAEILTGIGSMASPSLVLMS